MEIFLLLLAIVVIALLARKGREATKREQAQQKAEQRAAEAARRAARKVPPKVSEPKAPTVEIAVGVETTVSVEVTVQAEVEAEAEPAPKVLTGRAYVVDGDTITVQKTSLRLFGVDAPEMDHPHGRNAKWAMVNLCKGQEIRAEIVDVDTHGRTVAKCFLPDGRDLSAEMVKQGLALDWPKFSGGVYKHLEPEGVRKKLWRAAVRQQGRLDLWEKYPVSKG